MTTSGRLEQVARNLRSLEAAAMGGIGFAVLYIAALTLLGLQPDLSASSSEIADWYSDGGNRRTVILALNLAVLSVIAFLWFIAVIRRRLGDLVLRAGVLSRWLAILGYVVALVMLLLPLVVEPLGFGFPVWVAILSGAFLVRRDQFASAVDGRRGGP